MCLAQPSQSLSITHGSFSCSGECWQSVTEAPRTAGLPEEALAAARRTPPRHHLLGCLRSRSAGKPYTLIARPTSLPFSASAPIVLCGSPNSLTLMQERLRWVSKHCLVLPSIEILNELEAFKPWYSYFTAV